MSSSKIVPLNIMNIGENKTHTLATPNSSTELLSNSSSPNTTSRIDQKLNTYESSVLSAPIEVKIEELEPLSMHLPPISLAGNLQHEESIESFCCGLRKKKKKEIVKTKSFTVDDLLNELDNVNNKADYLTIKIFTENTNLETLLKHYIHCKTQYDHIVNLINKFDSRVPAATTVPEFKKLEDGHLVKLYVLDKYNMEIILSFCKFSEVEKAYKLMELITEYKQEQYPSKIACILKNNKELFLDLDVHKQQFIAKNVTEKSNGNINDDVRYIHKVFPEPNYDSIEIASILSKSDNMQVNQIKHFLQIGIDPSVIIKALEMADAVCLVQTRSILSN